MVQTFKRSNPQLRERMERYDAQQAAIARNAPGWKAARDRWAKEVAARGETVPRDIQSLIDAVANSEAPLRPEVRAELEAEIQRRIAAHKEKSNA